MGRALSLSADGTAAIIESLCDNDFRGTLYALRPDSYDR